MTNNQQSWSCFLKRYTVHNKHIENEKHSFIKHNNKPNQTKTTTKETISTAIKN